MSAESVVSRATDPRSNVVVAASAGTGKTWLLVSRMLVMLLQGVEPAGILAITFTRKAAGEMHERLLSRLRTLAVCSEGALEQELAALALPADDGYKRRARALFQTVLLATPGVRIQTFHAFCAELLRRFPMDVEMGAGFELIDYTELLQTEAWEGLCARATRQPDSPVAISLDALFQHFGTLETARQSLLGFLDHRADWWAFTLAAEDSIAMAIAATQSMLQIDSSPLDDWPDPPLRQRLADYAELLHANGTARGVERAAAITTSIALTTAPLDSLLSVFFVGTTRRELRKLNVTNAMIKRIGEQRAHELAALHRELAGSVEQRRDLEAAHRYCAMAVDWFRADQALLDEYQALKQQRRLLDFADLEWQAFMLLSAGDNAQWIQFKLDQRIEHMLVDEFQDTNPTQWQLIKPLLQEMLAGGEQPRTLFVVGDAKQSIYGFRRADPALQSQAIDWLHTRGAVPQQERLDKSWRSASAIVEFVNAVFTHESILIDVPQHTTNVAVPGRVEVLPINERAAGSPASQQSMRNPMQQPPPQPSESAHAGEARQLAAHVRALIERGTAINEGATTRAVRYGDVMLLVRSRTHVPDYERALMDAGVPFVSTDVGSLLETLEVRDLLALLTVLVTPFDDVALAHVLRSPLFSVTHEMLETLATHPQGGTWYRRLLDAGEHYPHGHPLSRAAALISRWRQRAGALPTHDLLSEIFHQGEVLARYRAEFPDALKERSTRNLGRLLELSLEIESGRYPSVSRFLNHLRALRDTRLDAPSEPPPRHADRLQVMTIHAAKGLEAPVVYLADTAANRKATDTTRTLVDWPVHSAQPLLVLPGSSNSNAPAPLRAMFERFDLAERREEQNLLYVALTRARQLLVISGSAGRGDVSEESWYSLIADAMARIGTSDGQALQWFGDELAIAAPSSSGKQRFEELPVLPAPERPAHAHLDVSNPASEATSDDDFTAASSPYRRGEVVHRLVEIASQGKVSSRQLASLSLEFGLPDELAAAWRDEALAVIHDRRLRHLFDPRHFERAWNEIPISFIDEQGVMVNGVIDRLVRTGSEHIIIDYKSHEVDKSQAQSLANRFQHQLAGYAEGVARLWPEIPVRTMIVFTALPLAVEVSTVRSAQLEFFG